MAEIFNGVGSLRAGSGRQVGSTGKVPESRVEYRVQIFTRDRFGAAKRAKGGVER